MSYLKNLALQLGLTIYYMDTDCIAISGDFDPKFAGNEIEKLKNFLIFKTLCFK